jgi:MFS transporter, DHA2 family, methylenomycin A resistance protein
MKRTQEMSAPTLPRVLTLQHPRLALIALSLGMFMVLLDSTILNIALPTIEHELYGSLESLQWIANSYTLIYASLLLTGGALGDRYGVRTIFWMPSRKLCNREREQEGMVTRGKGCTLSDHTA